MANTNVIIGAGLAGLMCACAFEGDIFEAGKRAPQHRALLRFRDQSVSKLTGIPFKAVKVYKEIHDDGQVFHQCSNKHANMYSAKVTGGITGRSIRDLSPVTRYIAPDDLYHQLTERHAKRIQWESAVNGTFIEVCRERGFNIINTAPLHVMLDMIRDGKMADPLNFTFDRKAIRVARVELHPGEVDVYQTNYFPGRNTPVYRASLTGNTLIIESIGSLTELDLGWVLDSFGIRRDVRRGALEFVDQKYGKIVDLPAQFREAILYELTRDFKIFSVGRFATWRNVLLDDVAEDIERVKRLINASEYGRTLIDAKERATV